ncbi:MAG: hypothetical protein NZL87_00970, partial [Thermomicrobium sp.]|nr:hypothetical protein [Thermomicrobium sp.]
MSQPPRPSHLIKPKTGPDDPELQETLQEGLAQVAPDDVAQLAAELHARRERLLPLLATMAAGATVDSEATAALAVAVTATAKQAQEACTLLERLL